MMEKSKNTNSYSTLSEADKKVLKIDIASFTKRMKARIKKVQGDESVNDASENFLLRHRYVDVNSL